MDGVIPPSIKAAQSSTRSAPASTAARTPSTLSVQISMRGMRQSPCGGSTSRLSQKAGGEKPAPGKEEADDEDEQARQEGQSVGEGAEAGPAAGLSDAPCCHEADRHQRHRETEAEGRDHGDAERHRLQLQ